jgi:hypothetical protein
MENEGNFWKLEFSTIIQEFGILAGLKKFQGHRINGESKLGTERNGVNGVKGEDGEDDHEGRKKQCGH